ncbi:hypothetical protein NIES23_00570 [Trichormus variabilis NIES-23]|uniref:Uncharacterized protein n=1 Tax=Trichormus variabilis NIES-23 TaxID=1973479 RepID=A0A1Z4KE98_ANAVA|nr:hypothetical protein NIES23_00570 [Trichormus variabilis NIES-23]
MIGREKSHPGALVIGNRSIANYLLPNPHLQGDEDFHNITYIYVCYTKAT